MSAMFRGPYLFSPLMLWNQGSSLETLISSKGFAQICIFWAVN